MKKKISFPVMDVKMVPLEKIVLNDYNPNSVAPPEMKLLKLSIEEDGFTQPIVAYYDREKDIYIVVDGAHRYRCAKEYFNLKAAPVVTIDKPIENRMASTIRHNRARGVHNIYKMVDIVEDLFRSGLEDDEICKQLGMSLDELLRMKQRRGIASIYANQEYSKAWK